MDFQKPMVTIELAEYNELLTYKAALKESANEDMAKVIAVAAIRTIGSRSELTSFMSNLLSWKIKLSVYSSVKGLNQIEPIDINLKKLD